MKARMCSCILVAFVCSGASAASAPEPALAVAACDADASATLDRNELLMCFEKLDAAAQKAAQAATPKQIAAAAVDELLDFRAPPIRFEIAQARLDLRAARLATSEPKTIGGPRWTFGRQLVDALDPRKSSSNVPLVLSYVDDRETRNDAFVAVGSITYLADHRDLSRRWSQAILPTLESDITTKNNPADSSLMLALPVRWSWINPRYDQGPIFDDLTIGIEPRYGTDRDLDREVLEVAMPFTFTSRKLGRAGYYHWFGPGADRTQRYRFFWQPTLTVEAGKINDSGGNADLEALRLAGDYLRLAPALAFKLTLPYDAGRVTLGAGYTHRFDVEQGWDRGLTTAAIQYDLTSSIALTVSYRRGRKPPDFAETEEFLIGVGLSQFGDD